jgi:hypothetical protein
MGGSFGEAANHEGSTTAAARATTTKAPAAVRLNTPLMLPLGYADNDVVNLSAGPDVYLNTGLDGQFHS